MNATVPDGAFSGLSSVAIKRFVQQVEGAAAFLTIAHSGASPRSAQAKALAHHVIPTFTKRHYAAWHRSLVSTSASRLKEMVIVFAKHPVQGPGAQAELEAFKMLLELTPAGPPLLELAGRDRPRAYRELEKHMQLVCLQFEEVAALADSLAESGSESDIATSTEDTRDDCLPKGSEAVLERAGGTLTLTEAAVRLGVSRQALHKRIATGTALGMMVDGEIIVPRLQFTESDGQVSVLNGIKGIAKLFKSTLAGPWMALQFLVDPDPNLGQPPIEALRQGKHDQVLVAARAHLHCDEE